MSELRNRRSERVMLRLNLLVRLEVGEGSGPQTHAFAVTVNAHGGLLESPFRMTVGQKIILINPQTGKEVACRVVDVHSSLEGYSTTAGRDLTQTTTGRSSISVAWTKKSAYFSAWEVLPNT
jgi:hypothetical protein